MPGGKIRQVYPWQETVTSDRYEGKFFHRVRAYRTDDPGAVSYTHLWKFRERMCEQA